MVFNGSDVWNKMRSEWSSMDQTFGTKWDRSGLQWTQTLAYVYQFVTCASGWVSTRTVHYITEFLTIWTGRCMVGRIRIYGHNIIAASRFIPGICNQCCRAGHQLRTQPPHLTRSTDPHARKPAPSGCWCSSR